MEKSASREIDQDRTGEWITAILGGEPRALGRMLSLIEARAPLARQVLQRLYPRSGSAHVIGMTGAAGSGKSTLIARLAQEMRRREKQVGILTIDPSSPLTGGALLGDRLRMRELFLDHGVFIRSLASRGYTGGIAGALQESIQLLDAAGKEMIFVETIGIGQDQVDIASIAATVVLVLTPESGDEVQALKAGIIELADLFVINKCDLPGAQALSEKLSSVLEIGEERLFCTAALRADGENGVGALADALVRQRAKLLADGKHKMRMLARARAQLMATLRDRVVAWLEDQLTQKELEEWSHEIAEGRIDPYTAAEGLIEQKFGGFTAETQRTRSSGQK